MEKRENKARTINNPDAAGLGRPEVAARVEVTMDDQPIQKGDPRNVPANNPQ
ncbi:hypothetical protein [Peribacillus sp. SCS-155]|uniref:hypothetical protein n=1 Tax=Peribacillus sedimenti TaxID=3115297 RepID=UPI00390687B5